MNGTISDVGGVLAATALGAPLILLPGYTLGFLTGVLGFRNLPRGRSLLCAAFLGISLLPALDSLLVQVANVTTALLANIILGLAALVPLARMRRSRGDRAAATMILLWLGLVIFALIDFDTGTALYQSVVVIDLVKHAALTRSIAENGLPLVDPFFARPEPAGYYYYFYTLCAVIDRAGGTFVDGRCAFAGLAFWTGIGLAGQLERLLAAVGLVRTAAPRHVRLATLLLLPAAGLDLLLVVEKRLATGLWLPIPEWLNEQVLNLPSSLIWVPHHVAAALAAWLGLLALAEAADGDRPGRWAQAGTVAVAGTAFAACAGLSIWVCFGAIAAAGIWLALLAVERRWYDASRLAAAGVFAGVLAAPYLRSTLANRSDEPGQAIAIAVRGFGPIEGVADEPTQSLLRLILLPVNYGLAFGVFGAGTLLFWTSVSRREAHAREAGRLLSIVAAAALLIGGFLRSTILNNDLGWRVVLLAQVAAAVWSIVVLVRFSEAAGRIRVPGSLVAPLLLGYATTLYGFVGMRAYPAAAHPGFMHVNGQPMIDRDLRAAYVWAGAHLPHSLVLQHDPLVRRVFDFGLYGMQRVGVADPKAQLFGASAEAVATRIDQVAPIFGETLTGPEVRRRASEAGIDALIVTERDAAWRRPDSWVWRGRPIYAGPRVRIMRVEDLDD